MTSTLVKILYFVVVGGLALYGWLGLITLYLYWRHQGSDSPAPPYSPSALPPVTVQLPLYNEKFVIDSYVGWPVDMVAKQVLKRNVLIGHDAVSNRTMLDLHRPLGADRHDPPHAPSVAARGPDAVGRPCSRSPRASGRPRLQLKQEAQRPRHPKALKLISHPTRLRSISVGRL